MANSLACQLKTLFFVLGCFMLATLIYTISIDGLPFRIELLTPWMAATLIDFYINILAISAWIAYKEAKNPISAVIWIVLLVCFGSITTCAYIFLQFTKLSAEEALKGPIYYVLLQSSYRYEVRENRRCSPLVVGRVVFSILGLLMVGTLIYTIITDGSPFRKELLTPWMSATLIDFYINVVALSVWVAYKEPSWISAFIWIVLLICFGSVTTCIYIVVQLMQLSSKVPVCLVLFRNDIGDTSFPSPTPNPLLEPENRDDKATQW